MTDAGHYNPQHPRGTKFSPRELKKSKENWVKIVQQNNIKEPSEPDTFLCQYFVCESYENLVEISNGDLSRFPINNPILLKNEIFDALNNVITNHPKKYRYANVCGEGYKSKEEYCKKYPDTFVTNGNDGKYSYFEFCRVPTLEELEKYKSKDGVLKLMMNHEMPIENISAIVGCHEDICCGVKVQEEFIFRKLWCSFLAITNISDFPIALDSIKGNAVIENRFSPFSCFDNSRHSKTIELPKMPIKPDSTVLLPCAVILPPLYSLSREKWSSSFTDGEEIQTQVVTHGSVTTENIDACYTFGGQINPSDICYKVGGSMHYQEVHSLDLTNMYSIDRHWECGSCPHLFFVNDKILYVRELLAHCEINIGKDSFVIPSDIAFVIIAEIEDETTILDNIYINGEVYSENITLKKSEFIKIPVLENDVIQVTGKYIPDVMENHGIPQGMKRNPESVT